MAQLAQPLMNKISRLEAEKQDLQDALRRTQVSLEEMQKEPKAKKASTVDWSLLFPKTKNMTHHLKDEFDSSDDGAASSECSIDIEAAPVEGEIHPTTSP